MSRNVSALKGAKKSIAECAVGLLEARIDAGQAHNVGGVTPYVDSLFHFVKHDFVGVMGFYFMNYRCCNGIRSVLEIGGRYDRARGSHAAA